jgi:hypothetical protein
MMERVDGGDEEIERIDLLLFYFGDVGSFGVVY